MFTRCYVSPPSIWLQRDGLNVHMLGGEKSEKHRVAHRFNLGSVIKRVRTKPKKKNQRSDFGMFVWFGFRFLLLLLLFADSALRLGDRGPVSILSDDREDIQVNAGTALCHHACHRLRSHRCMPVSLSRLRAPYNPGMLSQTFLNSPEHPMTCSVHCKA